MKYKLLFFIFVIASQSAYSAGYSNWAVPTTVELVDEGVLIHGEFGDPNECGKSNRIFVKQSDPSYESVLSMALSAISAKREMKFYTSRCVKVGFHWNDEIINENVNGQAVYLR